MSRLFYHTMQDNAGNLLFDVSGTMRLAGTGTAATIYGDAALTVPIANPMTNHPSFGSFKCYLGAGAYDFYMAKSGYTFETLTGLQGWGTMALQDASAVAITGGVASVARLGVNVAAPGTAGNTQLNGPVGIGVAPDPLYSLKAAFQTYFQGTVGIQRTPGATTALYINYNKASPQFGLVFTPTGNDSSQAAILFTNMADAACGTIVTTATTTAYNTTSDSRLKHDVETLTGELDVITALNPKRWRWNADDSPGVGLLAQEVAAVVQGVITGEPDAVEEDGTIRPQMIDYSKLVPFLVGAVKTLAARVAVLEDALGV